MGHLISPEKWDKHYKNMPPYVQFIKRKLDRHPDCIGIGKDKKTGWFVEGAGMGPHPIWDEKDPVIPFILQFSDGRVYLTQARTWDEACFNVAMHWTYESNIEDEEERERILVDNYRLAHHSSNKGYGSSRKRGSSGLPVWKVEFAFLRKRP